MRMGLGGPAVDEQAGGNQEAAGSHERNAEFGPADVVVPALEDAVDFIVQGRADLRAEEEADAERDVVQAADAGGFPVAGGPEGGKGGENKVHDAVKVGHVQGEDLDDLLRAEELKRTSE